MKTTEQRVISTIAEPLGVDEDAVRGAADIRAQFDMDSLDDIEIVMALEDEFGIEIEDEAAERWDTVAAVVTTIERAIA